MKKLLSGVLCSGLLALLFFFNSCQKEVEGSLPEQPPVSSKNPAKLSAAIKVWHGVRTNGTPPAPTGNTPEINPTKNPSVLAIAGRYAIIKPEVTAGDVAGYYLAIPGSGQYFKIDYTKPRDISGRGQLTRKKKLFQTESNEDSSIVIVLPPSINVPDTFCVTYWAYDTAGNIGQSVTTCIYVSSIGAGPNEGWLKNEFRATATWDLVNGQRSNIDTIIPTKFAAYEQDFYCDQTQSPPRLMVTFGQSGQPILVSDSVKYIKSNIRFAISGAFDFEELSEEKYLDISTSTCSQFIFKPISYYGDTTVGAYNYNATTHKLILVYEFDMQGVLQTEYWEYDLIKINDNHFILRDPIDDFFIRFEK